MRNNIFSRLMLSIAILVLLTSGCKEKPSEVITTPPVDNRIQPTPDSSYTLTINDFQVPMTFKGNIGYNLFNTTGYQIGYWNTSEANVSVISYAGLWLVANQDGTLRGSLSGSEYLASLNQTSKWRNKLHGVYYVTPDSLTKWKPDSLIAYGFPTDNTGKLKLYGDAMCWSSLTADTAQMAFITSLPLLNVRTTQTLFGYRQTNLRNVIFVRYDVTNLSNTDLSSVYSGFAADPDLGQASSNKVGYDATRTLTYTYTMSLGNYYYVTGYTFLQTPQSGMVQVGVGSHVKFRKDGNGAPDYNAEVFCQTPQEMLYALQGLSNTGQPMINPVTNQPTKFAFTGDPVALSGWIDDYLGDVRSLLATNSFSLNRNQTQTLTIAWAVERDTTFAGALNKLKSKIDLVRSQPSLWQ